MQRVLSGTQKPPHMPFHPDSEPGVAFGNLLLCAAVAIIVILGLVVLALVT